MVGGYRGIYGMPIGCPIHWVFDRGWTQCLVGAPRAKVNTPVGVGGVLLLCFVPLICSIVGSPAVGLKVRWWAGSESYDTTGAVE